MKIRKGDASLDRKIVTGMIVSTQYLKAVRNIYRPEYIITPFVNTVVRWCLDYFEQYEEAPNKHIQDIYKSEERLNKIVESQLDLIEEFLSSLSEEYAQADLFNVDYLLDETERAFRARSIKCLAEDIEAYLSRGELLEAESQLARFKLPTKMKVCGKPFTDMDALQKAWDAREEPLFKLPGAIGYLLNPHFVRGGFVAFLGREKIGKTWMLMELKMWALRARCNVAMFQLGDLTEDDYRVRQAIRIAGRNIDRRYCDRIRISSLDCIHNQRADCENKGSRNVESFVDASGELINNPPDGYRPCTKCYRRSILHFDGTIWRETEGPVEPLTWRQAYKAVDEYERKHKLGKFKLAVHPNSTVNVRSIEMQLDIWNDQDGFVPDVIFIDYADIMSPEDARKDERSQENERWKALRRLSQERHALVVTVTQGNRLGYDADVMQGKHVSEDKRKLSHVTAFFSLNQTPKEKEKGILRIAPIVEGIREGDSNLNQQVCVIQNLAVGQPIAGSYFYSHKEKKKLERTK